MKSVTPGEILQRFGVGEMPSESHKNRALGAWSEALAELAEAGLEIPSVHLLLKYYRYEYHQLFANPVSRDHPMGR